MVNTNPDVIAEIPFARIRDGVVEGVSMQSKINWLTNSDRSDGVKCSTRHRYTSSLRADRVVAEAKRSGNALGIKTFSKH
jgi:hypothetical protein